jgi:hypothetical protein
VLLLVLLVLLLMLLLLLLGVLGRGDGGEEDAVIDASEGIPVVHPRCVLGGVDEGGRVRRLM